MHQEWYQSFDAGKSANFALVHLQESSCAKGEEAAKMRA